MLQNVKKRFVMVVTLISVMFSGLMMPLHADMEDKTVHIGYYLSDREENYINWEGERVDEEHRILISEKTVSGLREGEWFWSDHNFKYENHNLKTVIGMKVVKYNGGSHSELAFGVYMEHMVTYMDWRNAVDHTYVIVDDKPSCYPDDFEYETNVSTEKEGYTFIGWYDNEGNRLRKDTKISNDTTVYARYVEDSRKQEYTIEHYTEDLSGQYKLFETETGQAEESEKIEAERYKKTGLNGFHFNADISDASITVGEDATLRLYYDRDIKTVSFMSDGMEVSSQSIKYEGMAAVPETPVKEGYRFVRWNTRQDGTGRDFNAAESVIFDSVYYAVFEAVPAYTYTVNYYQKLDDVYKLVKSEQKTTYQGSVVNASEEEKQQFADYGFNNKKSDHDVVINRNNQIVSYYYDKMTYPYTVAYYYDGVHDTAENESGSAYLNDVITTFKDKNREGYKLLEQPSLTIGKEENVLRVDYVRKEYQVKFYDNEGRLISTENVKHGDDVEAPEAPDEEGMRFVGWDQDLTQIVSDMDVHAEYEANTYTVEFQDMNGNTINIQNILYGKDALLPEAPEVEGYTFTGWMGNYRNILKNEIVSAQYRKNEETILPPVETPDDTLPPVQAPDEKPGTTIPPAQMPDDTLAVVTPQPQRPISSVVTPVTLPDFNTGSQNRETGDKVVMNENKVQSETENVENTKTPKAKGTAQQQWALVNLIATGLVLVLAVFMLVTKKEKDDVEQEYVIKRRDWTRFVGLVLAVLSIAIFLFTENILTTMTLIDAYTIVMVSLCLIQLLVLVLDRKCNNMNKTASERE